MVRLFGTSGIRGIYPGKVNLQLAFKVGYAVASYLKGDVVVGWDGRSSSNLLGRLVAIGALEAGRDVLVVGLAPTPVVAYSVKKLGASGGVVVTASHNPPNYNGFKVFLEGGIETGREDERVIERLIGEAPSGMSGRGSHTFSEVDLSASYVRDVIEGVNVGSDHSVSVVVDCGGGVPGLYTPRILRMLSDVYELNSFVDSGFSSREPEPRADVLSGLANFIRAMGGFAGFAHDGDGDRLAVIDEGGGFVEMGRVIALFAKMILSDNPRGKVVVSIDTSMVVKRIVRDMGGEVIIAPLGKTHIEARNRGAVLAAEPWKIIDPEWGWWQDGIRCATILTSEMIKNKCRISELLSREGVGSYYMFRNSYVCSDSVKGMVVKRVGEFLMSTLERVARKRGGELRVITIDGIKMEMEEGWLLVRASGTEPKIRLYVEADNRELYDMLVKEGERAVLRFVRELSR